MYGTHPLTYYASDAKIILITFRGPNPRILSTKKVCKPKQILKSMDVLEEVKAFSFV